MKSATIETTHDTADLVAAAITPDNTDEIDTHTDDDTITTAITRPSTGGLRATATDYIANLDVATEVVATIDQHTNTQS